MQIEADSAKGDSEASVERRIAKIARFYWEIQWRRTATPEHVLSRGAET